MEDVIRRLEKALADLQTNDEQDGVGASVTSIAAPNADLLGPRGGQCVIVEGRKIPHLTGRQDNGETWLTIDERFSIPVPNELAVQVAWLVANAMAVAAGYSHLGAETKDAPFAPRVHQI